jgi:hypothetical protein
MWAMGDTQTSCSSEVDAQRVAVCPVNLLDDLEVLGVVVVPGFVYICVCVCVYVYVYVCVCVYICVCTYVCVYTNPPSFHGLRIACFTCAKLHLLPKEHEKPALRCATYGQGSAW